MDIIIMVKIIFILNLLLILILIIILKMISREKSHSFSNWQKGYRINRPNQDINKKQNAYNPIVSSLNHSNSIDDRALPHFGTVQKNELQFGRNQLQQITNNNLVHRRNTSVYSSDSNRPWEKPLNGNVRTQQMKMISKQKLQNICEINSRIKNILDKINEGQASASIHAYDSYTKQQQKNEQQLLKGNEKIRMDQYQSFSLKKKELIESPYISQTKKYQKSYMNNIDSQKICEKYSTPAKQSPIRKYQNNFWKTNYSKFKQQQPDKRMRTQESMKFRFSRESQQLKQQLLYNNDQKCISPFNDNQTRINIRENTGKISQRKNYAYQKKLQTKHRLHTNYESDDRKYSKSVLFDNRSKQNDIFIGKLKSGKNLNDEIKKIQYKMKQLDKMRRQLDISQKKFNNRQIQQTPKQYTKQKNLNEQKKEINNYSNQSYEPKNKSNSKIQFQQLQMSSSRGTIVSTKKQTGHNYQKTSNSPKFSQPQQSTRNMRTHQLQNHKTIQINIPNIPKPFQRLKSVLKRQANQITLSEDKFIKLQSNDEKKHINKMIQLFVKQIELDSNFRNGKKWFQSLKQAYKWIQLANFLKQQGVHISQQNIRQAFLIRQGQSNPFYTTRQSNETYQSLIMKYLNSEQHWKLISKKFKSNDLINQGFTAKNLDLDKKGTITIQDFARYINFEANSFYRPRDISLIFKRFSNTLQVSYETLIEKLTK